MIRIAVAGDYEPARETHAATNAALRHAADALGLDVASEWISTEELEPRGAAAACLSQHNAVFLGPGSPALVITRLACSLRGLQQEVVILPGTDAEGNVRIAESVSHPFFTGTLFMPQMSSEPGRPPRSSWRS